MEQSVYQEHIEQEESHWWFVARRSICWSFLSKIILPKEADILEAGCGSGGNLPMLAKLGNVFAFELSEKMLRYAKSRNIGIVEYGKLPQEIPFAGKKFDLITMFDVLEHIEDDSSALRELEKRLNSGGVLFLTVPALPCIFSQHDRLHHHFRRYTKQELINKLQQAGFSIDYINYWNFFLFPVALTTRVLYFFSNSTTSIGTKTPSAWLNYVLIRLVSVERFIMSRIHFPIGLSILVVARKNV